MRKAQVMRYQRSSYHKIYTGYQKSL